MASIQKFKLVFFVPLPALQACKTAIFGVGAGRFPGPPEYTECAFTTKGIGQFRPGKGANPNVCSSFLRHNRNGGFWSFACTLSELEIHC